MRPNLKKVVKLETPLDDIPEAPLRLTDPRFEWKSSAATDVQATWRKYGWVPPSELRAKNEGRS
jgi:hypothetical protein